MTKSENTERETIASRRTVIGAVVGLGVAAPVIAACGSNSEDSSTGGGTVATKAEIPVGSGKIFEADKVVITQPTEGDFKAFSAVCTHQGCLVSEINGAEIDCKCHGSRYSIADGSVLGGPAPKPLPAMKVTASGEDLSVS